MEYSSIKMPSGRIVAYPEATVKIRQHFSLANLRWMYEQLRKEMNLSKRKALDSGHLELYKLVQRQGTIPKGKGTVAFWKSVQEKWNKLHPKKKYTTWNGAKITYERMVDKLRPK